MSPFFFYIYNKHFIAIIMAHDNFYGYSNKKPEFEVGGNIDMAFEKVNPYEFKKGMDFELNALGCPNLHSSTPEQREKATTKVLKNLEEMADYYSQQENYETETRNMEKAPSFKKFVESNKDQEMKEVDKEFKGDKMEKIKESIDAIVKQVLNETKSKNTNKMTKEDLNIMIAEELEAYMKNMEGTEEVTEADEIEVDVDSAVEAGGDAEDVLRTIYDMLKDQFEGEEAEEMEDEDEMEDEEVEDVEDEEEEELKEAEEPQLDMFTLNVSPEDKGNEVYFKFLFHFAKQMGIENLDSYSNFELDTKLTPVLKRKFNLESTKYGDLARELIKKGLITLDNSIYEAEEEVLPTALAERFQTLANIVKG